MELETGKGANIVTVKNTAETMHEVMEDLSHHDVIATPDEVDFSKPHLISMPGGRTVEDITESIFNVWRLQKPIVRSGTARLANLASLISWANRFKGETSVLYAFPDLKKPALTCIADYHGEGAAEVTNKSGDPNARHCQHRGVYDFPLSEEWKAWMDVSGEGLEKDELGEFIEANAKDIMEPTPAVLKGVESENNEPWENRLIQTARQIEGRYGQLTQLLAMSKKFQVFETSDLKISTNRDTGEAEIQFLNEHKGADGKPLNIPNLIIIAIPVFMGGAAYRMPVRFRYRKVGSNVRFILSVYNPEKAFEAAFEEAVNEAVSATELPVFFGWPET